ncbi:MAG: hypothetical protein U0103_22900 [Candidatus Obscuribacterales bacterium]|jgi:hypothetical protein|nr:hypothetical protein [Cyanobacteria bacterium SZAS LIN-5]
MESDAIFEEMATKMLTTMVTVEKLKRDAEKAFNDHDYQISVDKLREAAGIVESQPGTAARIELASILLPLSTVFRTVGDTSECEKLYKQIISLCTQPLEKSAEAKFGSSQVDSFMEQMMPGMEDMLVEAHYATTMNILSICAENYQKLLTESGRNEEAEALKEQLKSYLA